MKKKKSFSSIVILAIRSMFSLVILFFGAAWKILVFLLKVILSVAKLPITAVNIVSSSLKSKKEARAEEEKEKKREAMDAKYAEFEVIETKRGDFSAWEKKTLFAESKIGIILGARGSGKTAFGIKLVENARAKTCKKCYAMGFKEEDMPSWINIVSDIKDIGEDAFVLIDEGGVLFSSRESMSLANKFLSEIILVARHKNLNIIFISQNSANLDVNIIRQADYLVMKPSSLLQLDFERKKIKDIYSSISEDFKKYKGQPGATYIYSDAFMGFVNAPLPSFWSVKISKAFKQGKTL